jgi:8-oxo-dGTP diphosphatase
MNMNKEVCMSGVVLQVAAKALIVDKNGKLLVLREPAEGNLGSQDGLYGLVGGRLDDEDSYESALHREVFEETGLKMDILHPLYVGEWWPSINGKKHHIIAIFSVCRAKTTDVKLSEEHDDFKWILPEKTKTLPFMPPDDKVIELYASMSKKYK